jgi:ubiquinone/menaquinone biosynthesis C-methylase UbiE
LGEYKTLDINRDLGPDVVADAHNLPIHDNSVDGVISNSVLEHMYNPFRAVDEIHRVLRPGGKALVYTPFIHAYHGGDKKGGPDYWRFSKDGLKYLFREFSHIDICPVAGHFETLSYLLPYSHRLPFKIFVPIARITDRILWRFESRNQVSGFHVFLIK